MANVISHRVRPDLPPIQMNNGLTSVFVGVLAIAASTLAKNDRERLIAIWLASHDQGAFGRGLVDFDVSECPWDSATFDQDKDFLLSAIIAARSKLGWHRLDYTPREEGVLRCLSQFEQLVQLHLLEHVVPVTDQSWCFGDKISKFELCPKHAVYLHSHGCVLCNDMPIQ